MCLLVIVKVQTSFSYQINNLYSRYLNLLLINKSYKLAFNITNNYNYIY